MIHFIKNKSSGTSDRIYILYLSFGVLEKIEGKMKIRIYYTGFFFNLSNSNARKLMSKRYAVEHIKIQDEY